MLLPILQGTIAGFFRSTPSTKAIEYDFIKSYVPTSYLTQFTVILIPTIPSLRIYHTM